MRMAQVLKITYRLYFFLCRDRIMSVDATFWLVLNRYIGCFLFIIAYNYLQWATRVCTPLCELSAVEFNQLLQEVEHL